MLTDAAEQLVADHYDWAQMVARVWCHRHSVPNLWRDDLVSAGLQALMTTAGSYDPDAGVLFRSYARRRIEGAANDELRRLWCGRVSQSHGRRVNDRSYDISTETTVRVNRPGSADAAVTVGDLIADVRPAPGDDTDDGDLADAYTVIDRLPWDVRQIAAWYYRDGITQAEIGLRLGVTESRICQVMRKIETRLRILARSEGLTEAA